MSRFLDSFFQVTSIAPYFLIMTILLATGYIVLRGSRFYRRICIEEKNRFESLDGLRGFLAFAVFFHHACLHYRWFTLGEWKWPDSTFYAFIGPMPVLFFFMLTGFLFWGKAINKAGKINPAELYISRFWRIAPLYAFSVAIMMTVTIWKVGVRPQVPLGEYVSGLARILSMGVAALGRFNGFDVGQFNAWVTWTLPYEWRFYLALPLLALLVRPKYFVVLALGAVIIYLWPARKPSISLDCLMFVAGATAAYLASQQRFRRILSGKLYSLLAIAILIAIFACGQVSNPETFANGLGMFAAFTIIACGNSFFGVFTSAPAKFLGAISYSVYLLHGMVVYAVMRNLNDYTPVGAFTGWQYWLTVSVCGVITLAFASLTFRFIEHPCMHIGRKPPAPPHPTSRAGLAPVQA